MLTTPGCPYRAGAIALAERVCAELDGNAEIRVIEIPDQQAAEQAGFLGSPTIRVDGRDVEPDADRCVEYLCSCRLYQGEHSLRGGWGIGAKLNHLLFGFLEAEVLPRSMRRPSWASTRPRCWTWSPPCCGWTPMGWSAPAMARTDTRDGKPSALRLS